VGDPDRPQDLSLIVFATAGAAANGGLIAIWVASRTIGLPIGPHVWMPEPLMAPDVTATVLELLLVAGALLLTWRRAPRPLRARQSRKP
jgi:hypothetical protein